MYSLENETKTIGLRHQDQDLRLQDQDQDFQNSQDVSRTPSLVLSTV